ncbi:MAG TPA: M28 family metallopeptidase [Caulobacteraceae bacterium]|nr:M28 family metallopeptidase [Caulobacteraceae bacterium]
MKRFLARAGIAAILLASLSGASLAAAPAGADMSRVSQDDRALASDDFQGRGPATPGEDKAVAYIIARFKAAGLKPGGEHGGWTQDVPMNRFALPGPIAVSYAVGGQVTPLAVGDQVVMSSRKPGVDHVAIKDAPLVFVGYGVKAPEQQWDDYKGVDLHGKVAVVLVNDPDFETPQPGRFGGKRMTYYGRWTYKYEELARQGAAGVLIVHETAPAAYGWNVVRSSWTVPQFDIPRDPAERVEAEGWITREAAVAMFKAAGLDFDALKRQAQTPDFHPVDLKGETATIDFAVQRSQVVSHNVIGRLPGTKAPRDTVLYGAHWDHLGVGPADARGDTIYNGAADNASGVAGLIELGREFAHAPRTRRSIVFAAWTGEEKGLLGSAWYATHPLYPLARTAAAMNMDVLNLYGPTRDIVIVGAGKSTLEDQAAAIAARQGRVVDPEPRPEAGGYYRSDHFSFAQAGVPALDMSSGPDLVDGGKEAGRKAAEDYTTHRYHQPSDEWRADWNLGGAKQDLDLLYALGRQIANATAWPQWKPGAEFGPIRTRTDAARAR